MSDTPDALRIRLAQEYTAEVWDDAVALLGSIPIFNLPGDEAAHQVFRMRHAVQLAKQVMASVESEIALSGSLGEAFIAENKFVVAFACGEFIQAYSALRDGK